MWEIGNWIKHKQRNVLYKIIDKGTMEVNAVCYIVKKINNKTGNFTNRNYVVKGCHVSNYEKVG